MEKRVTRVMSDFQGPTGSHQTYRTLGPQRILSTITRVIKEVKGKKEQWAFP